MLKSYKELWNKITGIIRSVSNNSYNYDEKYMKIKFNPDDGSRLRKTLKLCNITIVVRSVFHEDSKYYPKVLLDECW